LGQPKDLLWSAAQLDELGRFSLGGLSQREQSFIDRSLRAARRRRWVPVLAAGVLLLAVACTYAGFRLSNKFGIRRLVAAAEGFLAKARASEQEAAQPRAEAARLFRDREREQANQRWDESVSDSLVAQGFYRDAITELQRAFALDPGGFLRRRLSDISNEAAHAAEEAHLYDRRDYQLSVLKAYDEQRYAEWHAPAELELEVDPSSAHVALAAYERRERAPWPLGSMRAILPGKIALSPDSYLLEASAPGYAPVRYPILLTHGEHIQIQIRLPRANRIPTGFVWIPRGRFRFGTTAGAELREFYDTVPIREERIGRDYLIAKHETTFAEWIAFLESLGPEERRQRLPDATSASVLKLTQDAAGEWRLAFEPTVGTSYLVRAGEVFRYRRRRLRASADWLKFPVSGITCEDAQAYAAWLRRSGRVPGARLCDEYEWERAARGADERDYPHGTLLAQDDANTSESQDKKPSALGPDEVGSHPQSTSPFGVEDLAGNVSEFVLQRIATDGNARCIGRGGSYQYDQAISRSTNRITGVSRDSNLGLRVCADPTE
jgi:formylglycine-generating enzyme required for sulfatase activity